MAKSKKSGAATEAAASLSSSPTPASPSRKQAEAAGAAKPGQQKNASLSTGYWQPSWAGQPLASRAQHALSFAITFTLALILYAVTMPSWVTMEDAGEFITSAYARGIPHPPGYPLYVWIGNLFTYLPFGTVAYRVHLFSAVSAAAAAGFITWIALRLRVNVIAAVLAGLCFAFSRTNWSQAVIAEVYALNAFFFFALLWQALTLHERFERRRFWVFCLIYGLSLANHYPLIILASGAFAVLFAPHWRQMLRALPAGVLFAALGLTPYLLLFVANTEIAFLGEMRGFRDLLDYVMRKEYAFDSVQPTARPIHGVMFAMDFFKRLFASEFGLLAAPLILLGAAVSFRRGHRWVGLAFLASVLSSPVILMFLLRFEYNNLTTVVFSVFHLIPYGVASLWIALGFAWLMRQKQLAKLPQTLIGAAAGLIAAQALALNWQTNNVRQDSFAYEFAKMSLESLPQNAVFLGWADPDVGPFVYTYWVEKVRPDVILSTQTGVLLPVKIFDRRDVKTDKARAKRTVEMINQWYAEGRRVFSVRRLHFFNNTPEENPFHYLSHGLYEEILPAPPTQVPYNRELAERAARILDRYREKGVYGTLWSYHRDFMVNRMCRMLVMHDIAHPIFDEHRDCKLMLLERVRDKQKDYAAADRILEDVMRLSDGLPLQDQIDGARHFFVNRMQLASEQSKGPERLKRYQEAVDRVEGLALKVPGCANQLALTLLEARKQVELRMDLKEFARMFGKCPKHRDFLKEIAEKDKARGKPL